MNPALQSNPRYMHTYTHIYKHTCVCDVRMLLALHQRPCSKNDSVEVTCHRNFRKFLSTTPNCQRRQLLNRSSVIFYFSASRCKIQISKTKPLFIIVIITSSSLLGGHSSKNARPQQLRTQNKTYRKSVIAALPPPPKTRLPRHKQMRVAAMGCANGQQLSSEGCKGGGGGGGEGGVAMVGCGVYERKGVCCSACSIAHQPLTHNEDLRSSRRGLCHHPIPHPQNR